MRGLRIPPCLRPWAVGGAARPRAAVTTTARAALALAPTTPTMPTPTTTTTPATARALSTKTVPYKRYRAPKPELTQFPEGHGEQIWIFHHLVTNQVVYSHGPILRNNRALRQLPFNGKKTKPAKLRKDYWRPMALVQFGAGAGVAGRSVFQKLREFRRLHELSWGHQAGALYALDRAARGAALSDQRANSVADLAAALAGAGAGNRVKKQAEGEEQAEQAEAALEPAVVFWANEQDRNLAEAWSSNVTHAAGLPSLQPAAPAERAAA